MGNRLAFALLIAVTASGCSETPQRTSATVSGPSAARTVSKEFSGPRDALVPGVLKVQVLEVGAPPRGKELADRLQRAAAEDPEWWIEHTKLAEAGKPLPYDARMGLSRLEYDEFLSLAKALTTHQVGEGVLTISSGDNAVFVLDGGAALPELSGIQIDLTTDSVSTPFGVLTERSAIDAPEDTPLGAWQGVQWKLSARAQDDAVGAVVLFALGRLKRDGRYLIYYNASKLDGSTRIFRLLSYELP